MFRLSLHLKIISVVTLFSSSISAANLDNPNWSYSNSESFDSTLSIDGYSLSPSGLTTASMSTNIGVVNSGDTLDFSAFIHAMASFMSPQSDVMIRDNLFINAGVKITGSSGEKIVFDLHDGGSYSHNNYFYPIYTPEWFGFDMLFGMPYGILQMLTLQDLIDQGLAVEGWIEQGLAVEEWIELGLTVEELIEQGLIQEDLLYADLEDYLTWEADMTDFLDGVVDLTPLTGQDAQLSFILQASTSGFYEVLFLDMYIDSYGIYNTNPVPVPAAAWLFGSALAGLGVIRRKK